LNNPKSDSLLDPNGPPEHPYEDIFFHSCKAPVEGLKTGAAIVDKIWEEFRDREVSRYELSRGKADVDQNNALGLPGMIYWKPGVEACQTFPAFMSEGHASCGLWSEFLKHCVETHKITVTKRNIDGKPVEEVEIIQAVADYKAQFNFTGNVYYKGIKGGNVPVNTEELAIGERIMEVYRNPNLGTEGVFYVKTTNITDKFTANLLIPNSGFPGGASKAQGNPNARAWFLDHTVIKYDGKLYDASYGGGAHSADADNSVEKVWEHASLESHGFIVITKERIDAEGESHLQSIGTYFYKGTPDVLNIKETNHETAE
jgi:hypothetical protein